MSGSSSRGGAIPINRLFLQRFAAVAMCLCSISMLLLEMPASADVTMVSQATHPHIGTNEPVTSTSLAEVRSQTSPTLAIDPTNAAFAVVASRIDGPTVFGCELNVSGDGGRGWVPANPVPRLPPRAEHCYAPQVGFDRTGRLYYLFVGIRGLGNEPVGAFLTTSSDHAKTFTAPTPVLGPDNYMIRMVIDQSIGDNGRLQLAWLHPTNPPSIGGFSGDGAIFVSHSDDGGLRFSPPVQASDPVRKRVVAPALAIGPRHTVYVSYYDLGDDAIDYQGLEGSTWDGTWALLVAVSGSDSDTFETQAVVDGAIRPADRIVLIFTMPPPALVADKGTSLYIAWSGVKDGSEQVLFSRSTDWGRSWAEPMRLNDDPLDGYHRHYLPQLSLSSSDRIDAIFYDRRDDPANIRTNVFGASSFDKGSHFTNNFRISSEGFYSDTGSTYPIPSARGRVQFGSQLALWSGDHRAIGAWVDTRMVPETAEEQDIYSAEIAFAAADRTRDWWRIGEIAGGAALILAVVLAFTLGRWKPQVRRGPSAWAAGSDGPRGWARRRVRYVALFGSLSSSLVVASSCARQALPVAPNRTQIVMREFLFSMPSAVPHGRTVIVVRNGGTLLHEMGLVFLPKGFPPLSAQLRASAADPTKRVALKAIAYVSLNPGESRIFAVDLLPGRYGMVSNIVGVDGRTDADKGMSAELRVR